MSRTNEKTVRNLRKKRIWPSIIGLIIFSFIYIQFITLQFHLFLSYSINGKMDKDFSKSSEIVKSINDSQNQIGWQETLNLLKTSDDLIEQTTQFCIVDKHNKIIVENADILPNFNSRSTLDMGEIYNVYIDTPDTNSFLTLQNNQISVSFRHLINKVFDRHNRTRDFPQWTKSTIETIPYWLEIEIPSNVKLGDDFNSVGTPNPVSDLKPLGNGEPVGIPKPNSEYKLICKYQLDINRQEILFALVFGLISLIIVVIPLLFFLVNVLTTYINQKKLENLIFTDMITFGNNWFYLREKGKSLLQKGSSKKKTFYLISIQMNRFRNYCICYGSKAGEELLAQINDCIKPLLSKKDLIARYNEADFALLVQESVKEFLETRLFQILQHLQNLHQDQHLSFSTGIYEILSDYRTDKNKEKFSRRVNVDINEMYTNACTARDIAKPSHSNGFAYFSQSMLDEQLWEHHIEEKMDLALQNHEFKVFIQPKYTPNNKLGGAEALVRWINDEDGFITPNRFIPIFEKNGFILKLDDYMLTEVSKLQTEWIAQGKKVVPVSINVSRAHFSTPDLAEHICQLVDEQKTPHNQIELELTESAFFDDKEILLKTVQKLQGFGFIVSMDDFGAGYSSLNSLKDLPLDVIKLDAEFFRGKGNEQRGEIVIKEAIQLAQQLKMDVVAEGIENKEQVDFLSNLGCDLIQGYYFAKPMPADEFEKKITP